MMVADTDVLIDFLQGAEPAARRIGLELEVVQRRPGKSRGRAGPFATLAVTLAHR